MYGIKIPFLESRGIQTEENVEKEGEGENDEEEEDAPVIPVMKPYTSRSKTTKPDQKGKGITISLEKPKKKPIPRLIKYLEGRRSSWLILHSLPKRRRYFFGGSSMS